MHVFKVVAFTIIVVMVKEVSYVDMHLWRVLEMHMFKVVAFTIIVVMVKEVSYVAMHLWRVLEMHVIATNI